MLSRVFSQGFSPVDTIAVSLLPITKNCFDFMQMRLSNRFSFVEHLGELINNPSNVKGSKRFFSLYIPNVRLFILE